MSQAYVGEVRLVPYNFAPLDWSFCQGQLIPISQNETLYNLIGTTYGGDGVNTFALPNLQGRVPIHQGQGPGLGNYVIGQSSGVEQVTLTTNQIPAHSHPFLATPVNLSQVSSPANNSICGGAEIFQNKIPTVNMANMLSSSGGNQPHGNMQPYLVLNWVISLYGIYPTQN